MTYEEAKSIAIAHNRKVNTCLEYEEGYRFFDKDAQADGGYCDFVVLKAAGKIVSVTSFICDYHPSQRDKHISMRTDEKNDK